VSKGVTQLIVRLILWTSTVCCLIVIASFAVFAVDKTSAASTQQAAQVSQSNSSGAQQAPGTSTGSAPGSPVAAAKRHTLRSRIDEAASTLRSPFSSVTSEFHDEWVVQLVGLLLALAVYGVLLRFIARAVSLGPRSA
jgi:cobalamin biosynthesis Mg chelatase CobN